MYTEFYGFTERPFDVNPDPKFLYLTESHRESPCVYALWN